MFKWKGSPTSEEYELHCEIIAQKNETIPSWNVQKWQPGPLTIRFIPQNILQILKGFDYSNKREAQIIY